MVCKARVLVLAEDGVERKGRGLEDLRLRHFNEWIVETEGEISELINA